MQALQMGANQLKPRINAAESSKAMQQKRSSIAAVAVHVMRVLGLFF
jgi:hypothetical protein